MLGDTPNAADTDFAEQHREWGEKVLPDVDTGRPKRTRYNLSEPPLTALARPCGKDGSPFLSDELVHVGERLREDYELAHMVPRVSPTWDRFGPAGDAAGLRLTVVLGMDRQRRGDGWQMQ